MNGTGLPQDAPDLRLLPQDLGAWLESAMSGKIVRIKARAGVGVSREGAEVDVRLADGRIVQGYLTYNVRLRPDDHEREIFFRREVSALRSVRAQGLRVPRVLAADIGRRVMYTEKVSGESVFQLLKSNAERESVAYDFIAELAKLHALDPRKLELDGFPPLGPVDGYVRERLDELECRHRAAGADPLVVYPLTWLKRNVPSYQEPAVLVHGDAGPSNFLYENGRVTAILDWELTHLGDPLEDLGWIALRMLFQPFIPLPLCFAAYERASGRAVDLDRVRFYRLYAQMNVVVGMFHSYWQSKEPFGGSFGQTINYYTVHIRTVIEALAESAGIRLPDYAPPQVPAKPTTRFFESALIDIKDTIVPRSTDEAVKHRTKGLARLLKYLQAVDLYGAMFEAEECADIGKALNRSFATLTAARAALLEAIEAGGLSDKTVIELLYRRVRRDTILAAGALGSWVDQHHSPLTAA